MSERDRRSGPPRGGSPGAPTANAAPIHSAKPTTFDPHDTQGLKNTPDSAVPHQGPARPPTVVGIGAPAAGLGAVGRLVDLLPQGSGLAFLVVVAASAEPGDQPVGLLGSETDREVRRVTQTVPIEPERVYVVPEDVAIDALDSSLRVSEAEPTDREAPIDRAFCALARSRQARSVGVVLAGTGADGAQGLKAIRAAGGLALAEEAGDLDSEQVLESLPVPLLVLDEELRVRSANPAYYRYFCAEPEATLSRPLRQLGAGAWDDPDLLARLEAVLPEQRDLSDYLVVQTYEDLGRRVMLLDARRVESRRLILVGLHDLTARFEAEQALRRSELRLEEENRRKDEFLAMLGHELRNPLGAIRSAAEVLKRAGATERIRGEASEVLDRQARLITRLVDDLLEVTRIARGKVCLEPRLLDLREVVQAVLQTREGQLERGGLTLDSSPMPGPLWVRGDDARLTQVLDNLLGNAIKFTPPSGTIRVSAAREGDSVLVRVRDTGVGIPADMLERVFEPFRQAPQDEARSGGGLGLGLALARGMVELHQGTIEARSDGPGAGAEVVVRLPLARTPDPEQPDGSRPEPDERDEAPRQRRILLVEDHPDAGRMLSELLSLAGHEVTLARDGPQALEALRAQGADVVLCDLGLPGMSGYEVARAIRADPDLRELPLLAVTGYGQPPDRERAAEAGFDQHILKPVDVEQLEEVLQTLDQAM